MDTSITVVVPVHNGEDTLEKSLSSVLAQTNQEFELLIVDDGSTDQSAEIARRFEKLDNRVHFISSKESAKGVSYARNQGIIRARGAYITFLDADDCMKPNLLEEYKQLLLQLEKEEKECQWLMCGMEIIVCAGSMKPQKVLFQGKSIQSRTLTGMAKEYCLVLEEQEILQTFENRLFYFVTNKLYDLKFMKENDLYFKESLKNAEDFDFNLAFYKKASTPLYMVNKPLYEYIRCTNHSLSLRYYEGAIEDTKKIYENCMGLFYPNQDSPILFLYLTDYLSRITAYVGQHKLTKFRKRLRYANSLISTMEFQNLCDQVRAQNRIDICRYLSLKTRKYLVFYALRSVYRFYFFLLNNVKNLIDKVVK